MSVLSRFLVRAGGLWLALGPATARAQGVLGPTASEQVDGVGWAGFLDVAFLVHAALALTLAVALGAAVAYPAAASIRSRRPRPRRGTSPTPPSAHSSD